MEIDILTAIWNDPLFEKKINYVIYPESYVIKEPRELKGFWLLFFNISNNFGDTSKEAKNCSTLKDSLAFIPCINHFWAATETFQINLFIPLVCKIQN